MYYIYIHNFQGDINENDYVKKTLMKDGEGKLFTSEGSSPASLPVLDFDTYLKSCDAETGAQLKNRREKSRHSWSQVLPLANKEVITSENMNALQEDWSIFKKGTLVFRRKTDMSDISYIICSVIFDTKTNDIIDTSDSVEMAVPEDSGENSSLDTVKVIVDGSLSAAEAVGKGLSSINPVLGLVVKVGAPVIKALFDSFFPKDKKIDQSGQLSKAVGQLITDSIVARETAKFSAFIEFIDISKLNRNKDKAFEERYQNIMKEAVDPTFGMLVGMKLLAQQKYKYVGISGYVLGITALSIAYKSLLLLDSKNKPLKESHYLDEFVNHLEKWIPIAKTTMLEAQNHISGRMGQIGNCTTYNAPMSVNSDFTDILTGKTLSFHPTFCCPAEGWSGKEGAEKKCTAARNTYTNTIWNQMCTQYGYYHYDVLKVTVAKLEQTLLTFNSYR